MTPTQTHFSKGITFVLLLFAILSISSCYSYRLATHAQGASVPESIIANSYFWGFWKKPVEIHTTNCDQLDVLGVAVVSVKANLPCALASIFTLGIWCPVKVEWECSAPCIPTGGL